VKYPYEFNDDTELSAYEYALFMDEMEREDRYERRRGTMYDDEFNDDYADDDESGDELDDDYSEDEQDDEEWDG
jgi:hypothetical protein